MPPKKGRDGDKGKAGKGAALMNQMGMFPDMASMDAMIYGDDDDDDLEAELLALQNDSPKKSATPARSAGMNAVMQLDKMVAESMRDDIDEDVSDTEDPDLLAELEGLNDEGDDDVYEPPAKTAAPASPPPRDLLDVLEERLDMYQTAYTNAKTAGETSKARRVDRGLKTIREMLKKAKAGRAVDEDDIPPPVATTVSKPSPVEDKPAPAPAPAPRVAPKPAPIAPKPVANTNIARPNNLPDVILPPAHKSAAPTSFDAPSPSTPVTPAAPTPIDVPSNMSPEDGQKYKLLASRRNNFKTAALLSKKGGDDNLARKYMGTAKQFDKVIAALEAGQPIDLSGMPQSPPGYADAVQSASLSLPSAARAPSPVSELEQAPDLTADDRKKIFNAPEKAGSVTEALQQRLDKYKSSAEEAKQQGNGSKARRMTRIVKQYEDAIKAHGYGRPVNFDDLPCPPGFPPLPTDSARPSPRPSPAHTPARETAPAGPGHAAGQEDAPGPLPAPRKAAPKVSPQGAGRGRSIHRQMSTTSRAEQQAIFLQERQLQFKKAAMIAKKKGDLELAKKYLRQSKGFDQMILASQSGLPVDLSQIPPPPGSKLSDESYQFVPETAEGAPVGDRDETFKRLEQELIAQIKTCTNNTDHFTRLGDVASANKFEKMGNNTKKDLSALKNAYKHGDAVPRYHYETRQFSLVQCCPELGDNDLELEVIRGLNYCLPSGYAEKDMDTYIKYELPYPNDEPQKGETNTTKHSISPDYNQSFKLEVNRKSRSFLRLLKSNKYLKLEIFYKRGIFKSDKLLGTVNIKLSPLENQCVMHESSDLMDGRKSIGGKLEFKVRVRDPFLTKQVEEVKEKWLLIDAMAPPPAARSQAGAAVARQLPSAAAPKESYTSVKVLEYEKQLLQQQVRKYQGKLNKSETDALQHKGQLLDKKIEETKTFLKTGGTAALKVYATSLERTNNEYLQEAKLLVQKGNREKAQILMTKKKLAQNEIDAIRSKIP